MIDEEDHKYFRVDKEGRYIFSDPFVYLKMFAVVSVIVFVVCLIITACDDQAQLDYDDVVSNLIVSAIFAFGASWYFKGYCVIVSDKEVIVKQRFTVDKYDLCDYLRLDNGTIVFADKSLGMVYTHFWFMSSAKEDALRSVILSKRSLLPSVSKRGQRSLYKDDPVDIVIHEVRMVDLPFLGLPTILLLFTVFGCFIVTEWTESDVIMIMLIMMFLAVIEMIGIVWIIRVSGRVKRHEIDYGYGRIVSKNESDYSAKVISNFGHSIRISLGRKRFHDFDLNDSGIYFSCIYGYRFVCLGRWRKKNK